MEKRFEDDEEFRKYLEEEYLKEADGIEQQLLSDDELEEDELSDEEVQASYEKLKQKLKDDGIYRYDRDARKPSSVRIVRRRYPLARVATLAFVSSLCVLAASLISEGNRTEFAQRMEYIFMTESVNSIVELNETLVDLKENS